MILAPDGRRMSKSLGTGIDPTELIAEHGADATRYGLLKMASTQDVRFSAGAIEEGRKLSNKLWNVSRLVLGEASDVDPDSGPARSRSAGSSAGSTPTRAELETLILELRVLGCDEPALPPDVRRFLRLVRSRRSSRGSTAGDDDARATALAALERLLKLLHPGDAARDRGDLVAAARVERRA